MSHHWHESLVCGSDRQVGSEWIKCKWYRPRESNLRALWISLLLLDIRFISGGAEGIGLGGESSCECGEMGI